MRDQAFNLILQVPALVGGVTVISVGSAELGHVALSTSFGCVVCSPEGYCLLVGQVDSSPSLIELGINLIDMNVLLSFLLLAPIFMGVIVLPLSPVLVLLWPCARVGIFLRLVWLE